MITEHFHPRPRTLRAIADGELSLGRRMRAHLASCHTCRDDVAFMRDLGQQAATLGGPIAGDDLLRRIRSSVAAGERIILPVAGARAATHNSSLWASAAALVLALALWAAWPRDAATASDAGGDLRFTSGGLRSAGIVTVVYRDAGLFHGADSVVLRGRFRDASGEAYNNASTQSRVATLVRGSDGQFHGSFRAPRSAVYGAFAVENLKGDRVDSHYRQLWTLLAKRRDGVPTFDALLQEEHDRIGGAPELALEALEERARLYSGDPRVWGDVVAMENLMLGPAHTDSMLPSHVARLAAMHERYASDAHVPTAIAEGLRGYAVQLADSAHPDMQEVDRYWTRRVEADRDSPAARALHLSVYHSMSRSDPEAAVRGMEAAWAGGDSVVGFITYDGLSIAWEAHDSAAIMRWADRHVRKYPGAAYGTYDLLLREPRVRALALDRLRRLARDLSVSRDSLRPLESSRSEQARDDSVALRKTLGSIGKGLLAEGHLNEALDTLDLATKSGWDVPLFRTVAQLRLAASDTSGALRLLAFIAVDPGTDQSTVDSANAIATRTMTDAEWSSALDGARNEMRKRVLADATDRALPGDPLIARRDGSLLHLREVGNGHVKVVTFWSTSCGPSRTQMPRLDGLSRKLRQYEIMLLPITGEAASRSLDAYLRSQHVTIPTYYDARGDAERSLHNWATPTFYVLDARGRVRFAGTTIDKVAAQAVALEESEHGAAPHASR